MAVNVVWKKYSTRAVPLPPLTDTLPVGEALIHRVSERFGFQADGMLLMVAAFARSPGVRVAPLMPRQRTDQTGSLAAEMDPVLTHCAEAADAVTAVTTRETQSRRTGDKRMKGVRRGPASGQSAGYESGHLKGGLIRF